MYGLQTSIAWWKKFNKYNLTSHQAFGVWMFLLNFLTECTHMFVVSPLEVGEIKAPWSNQNHDLHQLKTGKLNLLQTRIESIWYTRLQQNPSQDRSYMFWHIFHLIFLPWNLLQFGLSEYSIKLDETLKGKCKTPFSSLWCLE